MLVFGGTHLAQNVLVPTVASAAAASHTTRLYLTGPFLDFEFAIVLMSQPTWARELKSDERQVVVVTGVKAVLNLKDR